MPDDSSAVSTVQDKVTVVFSLAKDNVLTFEENRISMDAVGTIVRNALAQDEEVPVIIQSDPLAQHGIRTRVYDEVRKAGAELVTFTQG